MAIRCSPELKEAISETLEFLLKVKRISLSGKKATIFDEEVRRFYSLIPCYWKTKRISRSKAALIKHHKVFLEHEISLYPNLEKVETKLHTEKETSETMLNTSQKRKKISLNQAKKINGDNINRVKTANIGNSTY